jgi:hypothetical protein
MAATEEQITEQAQAGWKGFARFLFGSTAAVVLALILLGLFLL